MGNTYADKQNHDLNEGDVFQSSRGSGKLTGSSDPYISDSKSWNLVKGAKPRTLILDLTQSETGENWLHELFLKKSRGLGIRVPKHLVSLDEKYLRRCLEPMHINASKGAPCALSVNLSSSDMGFTPGFVTVARRNSLEGANHAIDYPMDMGIGVLDVSHPIGEGIVGSIMESSSMMSILRSPVFQRLGISDHEVMLGGSSLFENKRCIPLDYRGSPDRLTLGQSQKPWKKKTSGFRNQECGFDYVQQSPISTSSRLSIPTDRSSSLSFSPSDSQGMLQCTWQGDIPCFAFSLDDQKDLYVANAWKVEVANDKALDYVYSFHLKPSGLKMGELVDNESDLIGKMKVSTSFSLCSNYSKVMETEFLLVGANENHAGEIHASTQNNRQSRKLSKVIEMFKSGHSLKQRTPSLFGGASAIPEDFSSDMGLDLWKSLSRQTRINLSEIDFTTNLEMAAIVVKDHIQNEQSENEEVGGWGLKFLKNKQNNISSDASALSEGFSRNSSNCSTSIDIIVPEGHHGGLKNGPTSLLERWRSGGQCDCGGWDIGCPLKVLKAKPRREEDQPSSISQSACKSFDVFPEGSKQGRPTLKLVNIHEGLYFISFQSSSLSPLQCFSIAVAIIHSQSPSLRPKHVHD